MSHSTRSLRRLHLLCDALLDERIDEKQIDELQDLLADSLEMRRAYVRYLGISSGLHLHAAEKELPRIAQHKSKAPTQDNASGDQPSGDQPSRLAFWQHPQAVSAAAAAVALLVTGVATYQFRARAINEKPQTAAVAAPTAPTATLTAVSTPTPDWRMDTDREKRIQVPLGDSFPSGRIHLAEGLAQLHFHSGAKVVVQAPASFEVLDDRSMRFFSGKLAADLSAGADGFVTKLPSGDLVDLGTGFGLELDDQQRSEVHTLAGKVSLNLEAGSVELIKAMAARVEADTVSSDEAEAVPFDTSRWPSDVDNPGGSAKFVYFDRFDSGNAPIPLGSTAWEDQKVGGPSYRHSEEAECFVSNGTLSLAPGSAAEGRVTLLRNLSEMAGDQLQLGFEAATFLDQGTPFGFDLDGLRVELTVADSEKVTVRVLSPEGVLLTTRDIQLVGDPSLEIVGTFDFSGKASGAAAQVQITVEGTPLDELSVPLLESPEQLFLFGAPSADDRFFFDDVSIRSL